MRDCSCVRTPPAENRAGGSHGLGLKLVGAAPPPNADVKILRPCGARSRPASVEACEYSCADGEVGPTGPIPSTSTESVLWAWDRFLHVELWVYVFLELTSAPSPCVAELATCNQSRNHSRHRDKGNASPSAFQPRCARFRHLRQVLRTFGSREAAGAYGRGRVTAGATPRTSSIRSTEAWWCYAVLAGGAAGSWTT